MWGSETIATWSARFVDPDLESQFRREAMPKARRLAVGFCLIGLVVYPLGGLRDPVAFSDPALLDLSLSFRALATVLAAWTVWQLRRATLPARLVPPMAVHYTVACFLLAFLFAVHPMLVPGQLATAFVILCATVAPSFWPGRVRGGVLFNLLLVGLFALATLWRLGNTATAFATLMVVGCFGMLGILLAYRQHHVARHDYLSLLTERRLRHQLEEKTREAEAAARAKSEFLAVMSHEIRTPMNGILGMARLMLDEPMASGQRSRLETLRHSAEALLAILDDILDFSKLEAGRVDFEQIPFAAAPLFEDVARLMRPRAEEKGLALTVDVVATLPPWLLGDPSRLRQILLNLVGNAVKFTDQGRVTLRVAAAGDMLDCSVIDTGIGLDDEAKGRLFQSFSQADASTSRRYGGTGLGLAISKRLVEGQGGSIGVESTLGQGSRFWFRLPLVEAAPATARPAAAPAPDLPALVVLLAEDNVINQMVARGFLQRAGHRVVVANNGAEAVDLIRHGGRFDLVLMDMQMPEMDGLEATRAIRALPGEAARLPIVALTANAMRADEERCLAAGMNDFVAKPLDPDRLLAAMARVLAGAGAGSGGNDHAPLSDTVVDDSELSAIELHVGHEQAGEIVRLFLAVAAENCARMGDLAGAGDLEAIRQLAHDLKGMAGYVGASSLQAQASAIEEASRDGNREEVRALVARLGPTWTLVQTWLHRRLGRAA
ncbi:MAG TPA: ATP-binding protein [Magnetospirillum sp.]|nr:ATP-binding protein [Magnetospirillum sp.]